jgi:AraC-like DNA-binding protein
VPDIFAGVEALLRAVSSKPAIIRAVQDVLKARGQLPPAELAKALGLSARTLQRRLEEAGSSLRTERARHVSLLVEELLAGTGLDLDAIASRVGLASASHLVRHFRGTHGMTPGEWREQRRQRR